MHGDELEVCATHTGKSVESKIDFVNFGKIEPQFLPNEVRDGECTTSCQRFRQLGADFPVDLVQTIDIELDTERRRLRSCIPKLSLATCTTAGIDECALGINDCDANADCVDLDDRRRYECRCRAGFRSRDFFQPEIVTRVDFGLDDEDLDDLSEIVFPRPLPGRVRFNYNGRFSSDDDVGCVDINECDDGSDDCVDIAQCVNTPGSFECQCAPGFAGNGRNPLTGGTGCTDINECANPALNDCGAPASRCVNTPGSFQCACLRGFRADAEGECVDIDECGEEGVCDGDGERGCNNVPGSFECICEPGFAHREGDKTLCDDVDECAAGNGVCADEGGSCVNTNGGFACECEELEAAEEPAANDAATCPDSGVPDTSACGANELAIVAAADEVICVGLDATPAERRVVGADACRLAVETVTVQSVRVVHGDGRVASQGDPIYEAPSQADLSAALLGVAFRVCTWDASGFEGSLRNVLLRNDERAISLQIVDQGACEQRMQVCPSIDAFDVVYVRAGGNVEQFQPLFEFGDEPVPVDDERKRDVESSSSSSSSSSDSDSSSSSSSDERVKRTLTLTNTSPNVRAAATRVSLKVASGVGLKLRLAEDSGDAAFVRGKHEFEWQIDSLNPGETAQIEIFLNQNAPVVAEIVSSGACLKADFDNTGECGGQLDPRNSDLEFILN